MDKVEARVHRKNGGKQFACVEVASRFIFAWHRPADPLPRLITYKGDKFLLTQKHIDEAQVNQRAALLRIDVTDKNLPVVVPMSKAYVNRKGATEQVLMSARGIYASVAAAAAALVAAGVMTYVDAFPK